MKIPLLDLGRQHAPIAEELLAAVERVAEAQAFVLGKAVREFERAVADYVGAAHAVGVASGSDALYLSLRLLKLEEDDEVITSPFTFFATAAAIERAGGRTVFADIDPRTFNLDPPAIVSAVSERTRAIVPVHLFGQMTDMNPILELAAERGLWVIEDAAQAIGAKAVVGGRWRAAGTAGRLGCFSFYPTKNLGAWGDGGLITTDDAQLTHRLRALREHGWDGETGGAEHGEIGINSRLDALQAAVLSVKLAYLPDWTEARRANAAWYDQRLAGLADVTVPAAEPDRFHVYNQYTVRVTRRDELRDFLDRRGIGSAVYYPLPLHLQPCFSHLGYRVGDFQGAEEAARQVISLPVFPGLKAEEREAVAAAVEGFYSR